MVIEIYLLAYGERPNTKSYFSRLNIINIGWIITQLEYIFAGAYFQLINSFWGDEQFKKLLPCLRIPAWEIIEEGQMSEYFGPYVCDHVKRQLIWEHPNELLLGIVVHIVGSVIYPDILKYSANFNEELLRDASVLTSQICSQLQPTFDVETVRLLDFANYFPNCIDVEHEEHGIDENYEITIKDLVWITGSHITVTNGGRSLEGPINCILVPNIPVGEALNHVYVVHSVRVG